MLEGSLEGTGEGIKGWRRMERKAFRKMERWRGKDAYGGCLGVIILGGSGAR